MINLSLCCGATLIALAVVQVHQVSGFWFSDGSLSQEPATQINLNQVRSETSSSQSAKYVGQSNNGVALESQKESTIQVDPSSIQQQCQCSADWIQNQTKLWVAKWMAQQQSLAPSNSTGATQDNNINRPNAKQGQQASNNNNGSNNNNQVGSHWSGWVSKPAGNRASSLHEQARARTRKLQANQQQTGKRGERGPKGEQGARGQPGPAGLISVRDRDALLDLPDQLVSANQNGSLPARRLVFIENEQLLVMQADSGWRPVPLLAPLRDFRKTIAKPSVASLAHDRRKLLRQEQKSILTLDASLDNSIRDGLVYDLAAQSPKVYEDSLEDDDNDDDDDDDDEDDEDDEDADDVNMEDSDDDDQLNVSVLTKNPRKSSKSIIPVTGRSGAGLVDNSIVQQLDLTRARDLQQTKSIAPKDRRLKLRLVALNEPFSGNVHGIRGADFECKRHATRSQIKGSFRAFLASGFQNLNELVRYNVHKYPIVNLRGEQLANSWHDLFKQPARMANPLSRIYSFDGRHVASDSNWPNKLVWHGANNKAGHRDSMHNCDGWHSDSLSKFGMASPLHQPRLGHNKRRQRKRHLSQDLANSTESRPAVLEIMDKYPCRMPLIVLCIETIGQYSDSYVKSGDSLGIENNLILV